MHLSFVTYDRPEEKRVYLSGLEEETTPVQTNSWLDAYDIGANGFLRPQPFHQPEESQSSPVLKPQSPTSSFSAAGNKAATPGKAKLVQERGQARQLISGRNFRDILEASRPRMLGACIPSSLESLLQLKQLGLEAKTTKKNGKEHPRRKTIGDKDIRLKEWGSVDFSELPFPASRGNSPSPSLLKMAVLSQSAIRSEKSQNIDDASSASSYPTASSPYGTSFDRVFWDYYESPKTPGRAFQIQRSPSLEFDNSSTDYGNEMNEDSIIVSDNASRSSGGGESESNVSHRSKVERYVEQLKKFMEAYDATVCSPTLQENSIDMGDKPTICSDTIVVSESDNEHSSTPKMGAFSQSA
jgi:hypothetical protein